MHTRPHAIQLPTLSHPVPTQGWRKRQIVSQGAAKAFLKVRGADGAIVWRKLWLKMEECKIAGGVVHSLRMYVSFLLLQRWDEHFIAQARKGVIKKD